MATAFLSPDSARDFVSLDYAVEEFRRAERKISKTTLERQCRAHNVRFVKRGKANHASWTDLLKVHAAWVDAQDADD